MEYHKAARFLSLNLLNTGKGHCKIKSGLFVHADKFDTALKEIDSYTADFPAEINDSFAGKTRCFVEPSLDLCIALIFKVQDDF